jgi:hypothetical protein
VTRVHPLDAAAIARWPDNRPLFHLGCRRGHVDRAIATL